MEIATYKNRLEEEKVRLENELSAIGKRRTDNPNDWDVVSPDLEQAAFRDEIADRLEEMDERKAAEVSLEKDLSDINRALDKIEQGIYGRRSPFGCQPFCSHLQITSRTRIRIIKLIFSLPICRRKSIQLSLLG